MIDKIIDGMCEAIHDEFNDDIEIYTEIISQGLDKGAFSIKCVNPTNEQFLGERYFKTNKFNVCYFPKSDEPNKEINEVIGKLFNCLEMITVDDDLLRGTKMEAETSDGVLIFLVNYDLFVRVRDEEMEDNMETINIGTDVKG